MKVVEGLLESLPLGIQVCDLEGTISYSNGAHHRMLGYRAGELIGRPVWEFLYRDTEKPKLRELLRTLAAEQPDPTPYIAQNRKKDGEMVTLRVEWDYERDPSGELTGFVSVISDITEETRSTRRLVEKEARYRSLFETMLNGYAYHAVVTDKGGEPTDYVFLDVNPAFETMTGLSRSDVIGRSATEVIPGIREVEPDLVKVYGEIALTGGRESFEIYFEPLRKWYKVSAYSPERGYFVTIFEDVTETKRRETELINSESRFRAIFEKAMDGIALADTESKQFSMANHKFCEMLGYPQEEIVTLGVADIHPPGDLPAVIEQFELQQRGVIEVAREIPVQRKDGSIFFADIASSPVRTGGREFLVGMFRDVTAGKQFREISQRAKEEWEETFDIINDAITIHDTDFNILRANKAAKELLGLSWLTMSRQKCYTTYHGTGCPPDGCPSCDVLRTKQPVVSEVFEPHLGRHLEIKALPHTDEDGVLVGLVHVVRDISQRKKAEALLKKRNRQQTAIADLGLFALKEENLDLVLQQIADRTARTLGVEFVKILELQPDKSKMLLRAGTGWQEGQVGKALISAGMESQAGYTLSSSLPVVVKDLATEDRFSGPSLLLDHGVVSGMSVVIGDPEHPHGILGVHSSKVRQFEAEDITFLKAVANIVAEVGERHRAREKIQLSREDLERKVEERTMELTKANLRLEELDKLKSMFIASTSHELRTPLNAIIGFTGILLQGMAGEVTEEQARQLSMVKNSSTHLLALINDIIDVSKLESGQIKPEHGTFDLGTLVREVSESLSIAALGKDIGLTIDVPETLEMCSDERRMRQVLMNLVGNAVKFTDQGTVHMAAKGTADTIEITVSDTGPGIAVDDQEKLFRPFSQIQGEGGRAKEGTGLGLYLTKKIVELLGGSIVCTAASGHGSTFKVVMPRTAASTRC